MTIEHELDSLNNLGVAVKDSEKGHSEVALSVLQDQEVRRGQGVRKWGAGLTYVLSFL